jgi:histone deacetylase 1/2
MENANSYEYLEKIKIAVIENLKKTAPVPSVQMQDVPRASMGVTDEQDDEMDDLDEDENKDVRMTQRQWEKKVSRQDEYEDSDDEDMAEANGVYKTNGRTRKSILDYQNPQAVEDDMEVDSAVATPAPKPNEAPVDNDDTVLEDAEVPASPAGAEAEPAADASPQAGSETAKIDEDGDVDMEEVDEKTTEATIKTEEVDGVAISESAQKKSPAPQVASPTGDAEAIKSKDDGATSPTDSVAKDGEEAKDTAAEGSSKAESGVATTQPV